tara:strand:+ start:60 stop:455 length:396 start_codon:yes stop_codon:yes gene_type:complete
MLWSYEARNVDERKLLDDMIQTWPMPVNPLLITDVNERIVGVNSTWVHMCKFSHEEAFGHTPKILQGPLTNVETARNFSSTLRGGKAGFASLINYKKDGSLFLNHIYGWYVGDLLVAETYIEELLAPTEPQ